MIYNINNLNFFLIIILTSNFFNTDYWKYYKKKNNKNNYIFKLLLFIFNKAIIYLKTIYLIYIYSYITKIIL